MQPESESLYGALAARDPRFDGVFYVGVTSTGIYCRPICTARTPRRANCRFFDSAAAAEAASFRPCLRCRPELAPGNAPVDDAHRIAILVVRRIDAGALDRGGGLGELARQLGWSERQIRRIVRRELGVSPKDLLMTRRLLLAKQLLTETELSMSDVAFASGFSSVRRFNSAFSDRYRMPPTRLRQVSSAAVAQDVTTDEPSGSFTIQLAYRPPFDWHALIQFIGAHAFAGVERVEGGEYFRALRVAGHEGSLRVRHSAERRGLLVELTHSLMPVLPAVMARLRRLFDLDARPDAICAVLGRDPALARSVAARPGLRLPGSFDAFELAVRAVLGQQVSVSGATTLAARLVKAFGEPVAPSRHGLTHLFPTAERIAAATVSEVASLGIIRSRSHCIITLAGEVASGRLPLTLEGAGSAAAAIEQLLALPGIGPWTAQYIAMRAIGWPDAFPAGDMVLRRRLGDVTTAQAESRSQAWRPWRSYAALHLWQGDVQPEVRRDG